MGRVLLVGLFVMEILNLKVGFFRVQNDMYFIVGNFLLISKIL